MPLLLGPLRVEQVLQIHQLVVLFCVKWKPEYQGRSIDLGAAVYLLSA